MSRWIIQKQCRDTHWSVNQSSILQIRSEGRQNMKIHKKKLPTQIRNTKECNRRQMKDCQFNMQMSCANIVFFFWCRIGVKQQTVRQPKDTMSGDGHGRSSVTAAALAGTQNIANRREDEMTRTKKTQKKACTAIKKFAKGDLSLKMGEEKTTSKKFPEAFSCFKS